MKLLIMMKDGFKMVKITYICDFCKKEVETERSLNEIKVPSERDKYGGVYITSFSICNTCYNKLQKEIQKLIKPWGTAD